MALAPYRLRQFARSVGARPSRAQLAVARDQLNDAQWRLFCTMAARDQWHAVETLRLVGQLREDPDVAVAALLHDAGKGYVRLHERVIYVVVAAVPRLRRALESPRGWNWRTAIYRSARHAETSAALALAAGASAHAAALIRGHHDATSSDPLAKALAIADDRA